MKIETTQIRPNGSIITLPIGAGLTKEYVFKPQPPELAHTCFIANQNHVAMLLAIPEAFRLYQSPLTPEQQAEAEAAELAAALERQRIEYEAMQAAEAARMAEEAKQAILDDATRAIAGLRINSEYLTVENKEVPLRNERSTKITSGATVAVTVENNTATVTISKSDGLTVSQAEGIINSLRYRNSNSRGYIVPSLKVIRITRVKDNGGQQRDSQKNPIGSDTRIIDDIGTTVRVAGTTLEYTFPPRLEQDDTDEAGQNDPPTINATPLNPSFDFGGAAVLLFTGCDINTVEAGQRILEMRLTVENLTNAVVNRRISESILYAYTYVSQFGEESAPSRLTSELVWSPGQGVMLSNIGVSVQTPRITRKRIYRSQSGASGTTDLYFVGEISNSETIFYDAPDSNPAAEPLSSLNFDQPPNTLSGIVAMPNGMVAGFSGKEIWFCEPWKPHAWPEKYKLLTDFPIRGMATAGSTLVIMTSGHPYIAQGTHPENVKMDRIEVNYPCLSKRSIVDLGYAVVYASATGLVMVDQGGARLISEQMFSSDQWDDMQPETFVASQHQGRYILSYTPVGDDAPRRCVIMDLSGADPFVIRTSAVPQAFCFQVGSGKLYFINTSGAIFEFDSPDGAYDVMRWKSAPFALPFATNLGAILIEGDKISKSSKMSCRVYADGRLVDSVSVMNSAERLSSGHRAKAYEIEIVGTYQVYGVHLARTVSELMQRTRV